jgi:hypothetical protein
VALSACTAFITGGAQPNGAGQVTGGGAASGGDGGTSTGSTTTTGGTSAGTTTGGTGSTGTGPIGPVQPISVTHPAALPARMLVGIKGDTDSWMKASGVAWDVQWDYFNTQNGASWYNGFAGGAASTTWAAGWMQGIVADGYIPGVQYYELQNDYSPSTSDGANVLMGQKRLQSASTMNDYFSKVKIFLQAAKTVSPSPVIMIIEGDTFAYIEHQSNNDPTTPAAIASSGLPELAGLPDTVAGFGLAFLALRKSVGATNVVMGPDLPSYVSIGGDFLNYNPTADLQTQVDYQFTSFFSHFGVGAAANVVGAQFDFVASCPASADTALYAADGDTGRSWDASDSASINSESFNRYAEWLRLFHVASQTPWLIWQIPMGNSNSPNVPNAEGKWAGPYSGITVPAGCTSSSQTGCPSGYKDNRPEYFFAAGPGNTAHLQKFATSGVFGLFFGAGTGGASDQSDDYYTDGKLFMSTHVDALIKAGAFALSP